MVLQGCFRAQNGNHVIKLVWLHKPEYFLVLPSSMYVCMQRGWLYYNVLPLLLNIIIIYFLAFLPSGCVSHSLLPQLLDLRTWFLAWCGVPLHVYYMYFSSLPTPWAVASPNGQLASTLFPIPSVVEGIYQVSLKALFHVEIKSRSTASARLSANAHWLQAWERWWTDRQTDGQTSTTKHIIALFR